MKRWLAVYDCGGGISEVQNVGIFDSPTKDHALELAVSHFHTTDRRAVKLFDLEYMPSCWIYFR